MSQQEWLRPGAANRRGADGAEITSLSPAASAASDAPERSTHTSSRPESLTTTQQTNSLAPVTSKEWRTEPPRTIFEPVREDRSVNRKLRGIHLFMITVNGTLGTGLYWRGGQILELGGPLAVLLAFLLVGLLAWSVMQCITELLCIWPIPGALHVYVAEFVDTELGIATGMAYWFTYAVSYAALIATAASEFNFWMESMDLARSVDAGLIYVLFPLILIAVNSFGIQTYGFIEVVSGFMKIAFLLAIVALLIAIDAGVHGPGYTSNTGIAAQNWESLTAKYDPYASTGFASALFMGLSISAFAYVGVEIVAASALEAEPRVTKTIIPTGRTQEAKITMIGRTVKFSAIFISVLATITYVLSGILITLGIAWDDKDLPRVSWLPQSRASCEHPSTTSLGSTSSAFVLIARKSGLSGLDHAFNVFLFLTALTCANTNLYVASRALFGLTCRLDVTAGQSSRWQLRALAWFGKTNHRKVPMRAMVCSALAFCWVPFIQLAQNGTESCSTGGMIVEVLAEMGSVGVLIVWGCNCLAFIRYYHCIYRHRKILESQKVSQVRRFDVNDWHDYPYRSHGQPLLAYLAFAGCLFILIVANGASLWKDFKIVPFLSSYLIILAFVTLWVILKVYRHARWSWTNLSEPEDVVRKIRRLHEFRVAAT
ncbi:unnamed protein product [Discula destructiva]